MEGIKLEVQVRTEIGTSGAKSLRRNDFIPAVVYGGNKKETLIQIDRRTFEKIERAHRGESVVMTLSVLEGDKKLKDYAAIIKEMQNHPVSEKILHVDFQRISLTEEIEVKVPLIPRGEPIGVRKDGGSLDQVMWEVDIICLPTNIPANIEVDVSELNINDTVQLKDISLPENVKSKHDMESILFAVKPPMKEEASAEEGAEEAATGEPEVIKEKKEKEASEKKKPEEQQEKS